MTQTNDNLVAGSTAALVTPFTADGESVDETAWTALIRAHVSAGTNGVVVAGSTGESAVLSAAERDRLLMLALETTGSNCRVLAGTGSASTAVAVAQSRRAAVLGAAAVLVVAPYYNRPPQRGLVAHFRTIADACPVPVVLYNVPARTASDLLPESVAALASHPNIVAIKEAVPDMQRVRSHRGAGLDVVSGDDATALEALRAGAKGVISVAANIVPRQFAQMCHAVRTGEVDQAHAIDHRLQSLYRFLALESNPMALKWLLAEAGRIHPVQRLPLVALDEAHHEAGRALLNKILADEEAALDNA